MSKACVVCGGSFERRSGERPNRFARRVTCTKACAMTITAQARRELYRQRYGDVLGAEVSHSRRYYLRHREEFRIYRRSHVKVRKQADPAFAILWQLRIRLCDLLRRRRGVKSQPFNALVGCSLSDLRRHLESQFLEGMTWTNRRLWEVDHIRPCASFDLTDPVQQRECFHYTNLRPLWREENRRKGARW